MDFMAIEKADAPKKATRRTKKNDTAANGAEKAVAAPKKSAPKKTAAHKPATKKSAPKDNRDLIFALDIGTRSVIGIVAAQEEDGTLTILDTTRREHKTRAMLDGQIHDVPQVAAVIGEVKRALEASTGPLKSVAVAAAGRALYTMTAEAEMDFAGVITAEGERLLDFSGVQAAQAKLAESSEIDDPTRYYCVGYSTIQYSLDGIPLKSLVGQRGSHAEASVIATFLPRQVVDSMDSALTATNLSLKAVTLEPIAAINVLIPPTMRHLNLVLVDIGAGTSDVAITKNGSVIAYGMVPQAGDEITEAISQKFLLDFNVAERIKRDAAEGKDVDFMDILGMEYHLKADEILDPIMPAIQALADAIARQIVDLNGDEPQAVLLVGGGALTPRLATLVADKLSIPVERVAVRRPNAIDGVSALPPELMQPDAVTPLGILKIASLNTLHFLTVYVSGEEHRLFNFRNMTVADALLAAGVQIQREATETDVGLHIEVDGEAKFFPGTIGSAPHITVDGAPADLDTIIESGAHIEIEAGNESTLPTLTVGSVLETKEEPYTLYINGNPKKLAAAFLVNDEPADENRLLADGDVVTTKKTRSVGEALKATGYPPTGKKIKYKLNGAETQFTCIPEILLNDEPTTLSTTIYEGDRIEYHLPDDPKLGEVLGLSDYETSLVIYFNGAEKKIPSAAVSLELNGRPATANTIVTEGCSVKYELSERRATLVSTALMAVGFTPPEPTSGMHVTIKVNDTPATFTDPIMNGDHIDVDIQLSKDVIAKKAAANVAAKAAEPSESAESSTELFDPAETAEAPASEPAPAESGGLKEGLLSGYLAQLEKEKAEALKK
ncbi:MAG: rod shape-determining protein [Schwartzia sp.]|nr:rod shape-determining protein [Schwartzia sp. (in: firmicutes)]